MPMIEGASNFTIGGNARFYETHGNVIIVNPSTDTDEQKRFLSVVNLPRVQASRKDYETWKKSSPCFPGTREALLREMMDWITDSGEAKMYVLSGLAGIGKSTVAYTLATQAEEKGLLGASFFFSRDDDNRNNAKRFFSTVAYQLCVYNESFSKTIGDVLLTERGFAATTQDPLEQLNVLIVEPLQSVVQSSVQPILVVVDALDECNEKDEHAIFKGLTQLVRLLPSFKVILTTRPQPLVNYLFANHDDHKIFYLQDIEDKVVDGDIRLYLEHNLALEQIQNRYPKRQWCASDDEIDSLVHAAGRLFIIASTAVRYILDNSASNPAAQMQKLLSAFTQAHIPFKDLDHFYTAILRNVIPVDCDDDDIVSRYQSVVGTIVFIQRPLPVFTLARLINIDVDDIRAVLDNLQSVILLGGDDVPCIYHQSFPDYLTDRARCKDPCLQLDPRICHRYIMSRCFEIMDKHLKYNILSLSDPARFMSNEDGFKEDGITDDQLEEKIPQYLRYACVYWINHFEGSNTEDVGLMNRLQNFMDEHMLHWFEVLSLIRNFDSAHRAILKLLKLTPSNLHQLLHDALRFNSKFYELIERSALHIYHSALPFIPTDTLFYRRYIKEAVYNICSIEGGPEKWDALVANLSHGEGIDTVQFALDGPLFATCNEAIPDKQGKLKIWDAATGTPISNIPGHKFAVADDFSTIASSEDNTIIFYNMNGSTRRPLLTTASKIEKLALSSESSRLAAALSDGTVWLWDSRSVKFIAQCQDFGDSSWGQLRFSPTGTRLAYWSVNGIIKLWDGISGRPVADLQCRSGEESSFIFSGDGSRIASLSREWGLRSLGLWNSENGGLIGDVTDDWHTMAFSPNGPLLATACGYKVVLWWENRNQLSQVGILIPGVARSMAFSSDDILAIATDYHIKLYDITTCSLVSALQFAGDITASAFSSDCTRLAVGKSDGSLYLWDIRGINTSGPPAKEKTTAVTALALSRDCSRLACGFEDGTVELWGTTPTRRRIGAKLFRIYRAFHKHHTDTVTTLAFSPDGKLFASGSYDRTVKVWKGGDGSLRGTLPVGASWSNHWTAKLWKGEDGSLREALEAHSQTVALTNTVLAAAGWNGGVKLWSLDTLRPIHTFIYPTFRTLSISDDSAFVAVVFKNDSNLGYFHVVLLDVVNRTTITTFNIPFKVIHTMTFLRDNSQLVLQSGNGNFLTFNLRSKEIAKGPMLEHLAQLPDIPLWCGVPIWHRQDKEQHCLSALFPQHPNPIPVLWIPRDLHVKKWVQGSSMVALGCEDGRVILIQLSTGHVN